MTTLLFFFNDTATTEIYTLSLHDALPILFRFRLPARLRSMDLRRRHQLGNSRPLAGSARSHRKRRQPTVNGRPGQASLDHVSKWKRSDIWVLAAMNAGMASI